MLLLIVSVDFATESCSNTLAGYRYQSCCKPCPSRAACAGPACFDHGVPDILTLHPMARYFFRKPTDPLVTTSGDIAVGNVNEYMGKLA